MPSVAGILKPRIILPAALIESFEADALRTILLHEDAHRRRRDPLLAAVLGGASVFFFYYPPLWMIRKRLRAATEFDCDARVLSRGEEPEGYAAAIARTLALGLARAAQPAMADETRPTVLRQRFDRISDPGRFIAMRIHTLALTAAAAAVAAASFVPLQAGSREPVLVTGDVSPPNLLVKVPPEYPDDARRAQVEGKVILEAVIDTDGNVVKTKPLREIPGFPSLTAAAEKAIRAWRYQPATEGGVPVPVYFTVIIEFSLEGAPEIPALEALEQAGKPLTLSFQDASLGQILEEIAKQSALQISVAGILPDVPRLTFTRASMPLKRQLEKLAKDAGLTYVVLGPEKLEIHP